MKYVTFKNDTITQCIQIDHVALVWDKKYSYRIEYAIDDMIEDFDKSEFSVEEIIRDSFITVYGDGCKAYINPFNVLKFTALNDKSEIHFLMKGARETISFYYDKKVCDFFIKK